MNLCVRYLAHIGPQQGRIYLPHQSVENNNPVSKNSVQTISVIVPANPFLAPSGLGQVKHCLAALDVDKLMTWWPGRPHTPNRDAQKVRAIQRSLDWKRVTQIAAYLLQREVTDAPDRLDEYFREIYDPTQLEPGREWPPKVPRVVGFVRSEYPTFSNVLLHVNGATVTELTGKLQDAAELKFDENDKDLNFSVIDGQHRINGAYLALQLLREEQGKASWEIPAEVFLDLDEPNGPPRHQAQIFIDVNFYQKKVDRSLVADLFPTARGPRGPLDNMERAQDIGRRLMLETGPLVGMIQIPGIRYGVKDVVTLATLNRAVEDVVEDIEAAGIRGLDNQADFLAQCLDAWLEATNRKEDIAQSESLDPENVAYQGRVLVSFVTLIPACIWELRRSDTRPLQSTKARLHLRNWLAKLMKRAGLLDRNKFLPKRKFREKGYLGSGGIGRFRDVLWAAALSTRSVSRLSETSLSVLASTHRERVKRSLALDAD